MLIKNMIIPLFGGFFYASAFPIHGFPSFYLGTLIGIILFFFSLSIFNSHRYSIKKDFLSWCFFSIGYNLFGYYWIPKTLYEFGQIPPPLNYMLGLLASFILLPQYLVLILGIYFYRKFKIPINKTPTAFCFYALILTLLEYYIPQQFPAHVGHAWLWFAPRLIYATIFGAPFYSFIFFWLALEITFFVHKRKLHLISFILIGIIISFNFIKPIEMSPGEYNQSINVRLAQANIGNFQKLSSEKGEREALQSIYDRYKKLSVAPSDKEIDLIVWPETSYPQLQNSEYLKLYPQFLPPIMREIVREKGAAIFFGGYDRSKKNNATFFETEYNSAFLISKDEQFLDVYNKIKLIPFGEALPLGPLNHFLSQYITNISYFASGDRYTLFKLNNFKFTAAICYEILFSSFIRDYLNGVDSHPQFIINLTNDSWYGDTSEPYQHLFLAKWRALEFDLPIIRMTNSGISSVIYPNGSESERLKIGEEKSLDVSVSLKNGKSTWFQFWGIWGTVLASLLICFLTYFIRKPSFKRS